MKNKNILIVALITLLPLQTYTARQISKQAIKIIAGTIGTALTYDYGSTELLTLENISLHEAAHAVVAETLHPNSVNYGEISKTGGRIGLKINLKDLASQTFQKNNIKIAYAGGIQDTTYYTTTFWHKQILSHELGLPLETMLQNSQQKLNYLEKKYLYEGDIDNVNTFLSHRYLDFIGNKTEEEIDGFLLEQFKCAEEIVSNKQAEIKAVAKALAEKKYLTGHEIRHIIANTQAK